MKRFATACLSTSLLYCSSALIAAQNRDVVPAQARTLATIRGQLLFARRSKGPQATSMKRSLSGCLAQRRSAPLIAVVRSGLALQAS